MPSSQETLCLDLFAEPVVLPDGFPDQGGPDHVSQDVAMQMSPAKSPRPALRRLRRLPSSPSTGPRSRTNKKSGTRSNKKPQGKVLPMKDMKKVKRTIMKKLVTKKKAEGQKRRGKGKASDSGLILKLMSTDKAKLSNWTIMINDLREEYGLKKEAKYVSSKSSLPPWKTWVAKQLEMFDYCRVKTTRQSGKTVMYWRKTNM